MGRGTTVTGTPHATRASRRAGSRGGPTPPKGRVFDRLVASLVVSASASVAVALWLTLLPTSRTDVPFGPLFGASYLLLGLVSLATFEAWVDRSWTEATMLVGRAARERWGSGGLVVPFLHFRIVVRALRKLASASDPDRLPPVVTPDPEPVERGYREARSRTERHVAVRGVPFRPLSFVAAMAVVVSILGLLLDGGRFVWAAIAAVAAMWALASLAAVFAIEARLRELRRRVVGIGTVEPPPSRSTPGRLAGWAAASALATIVLLLAPVTDRLGIGCGFDRSRSDSFEPLPARVETEDVPLRHARAAFITRLAAPKPGVPHPAGLHGNYQGPLGEMPALLAVPTDRKGPMPALVWVSGPSPRPQEPLSELVASGVVVMAPRLRCHAEAPGVDEQWYGELDDLLAARDHLASLPFVDPARIYLAGEHMGGTLALLAAVADGGFRAVFALEGQVAPFGLPGRPQHREFQGREAELRTAIRFAPHLSAPLVYFGRGRRELSDAQTMQALTTRALWPMTVVRTGERFDLLHILAREIPSDDVTRPFRVEGWDLKRVPPNHLCR